MTGWLYTIPTGAMVLEGSGFAFQGYSGFGVGKNNPAACQVHDVGPIPPGDWLIQGPPTDTPKHGPYVLRLEPAAGTETYGRMGFLIHGDSLEHPGAASHGCIILPRWAREAVWASGILALRVTAEPAPQAQKEATT